LGQPRRTRPGDRPRSFIEEARRKQILEIAIKEIDRRGYRNTSVDAIAARAGISKGVVYYHFAGKRELVGTITGALLDELFEYRKARVEAETSASARLRAYIEAYFEFVCANSKKFGAMMEAGIVLGSDDGGNPWASAVNERAFDYIARLLAAGQESGEFREFPSRLLAPVIQGAVDGIALHWFSDPQGVNLAECKREIEEMIETYVKRCAVSRGRDEPKRESGRP
jgi:TetR/AcrR family transcriptional regulator, fatty acid metabolism regulator protein